MTDNGTQMTEAEWRAREALRRYWGAFCDADQTPAEFIDQMEAAGFAKLRKVNLADMQDGFASERGIYPGGDMWVLTDLGHSVFADAGETP